MYFVKFASKIAIQNSYKMSMSKSFKSPLMVSSIFRPLFPCKLIPLFLGIVLGIAGHRPCLSSLIRNQTAQMKYMKI